MVHNILKRIISLSFLVICFAIGASAQANADAAFKQGQSYQQTMTREAQNEAIKCFTRAKKMYDSATNKKKCDNAIRVSVNIKKKLSNHPTTRPRPDNKDEAKRKAAVQSALSVSNDRFELDSDPKTVSVSVTTKNDSWDVNAISGSDGTSFITIEKKDDDTFDIICEENTSTKKRSQKVLVTAGDSKQEIVVSQQGIPVILRLDENLYECSWKGGDKTIDVYCNSETTEEDNNEQNWRVESKPDWVSVIFTTKKQSLLAKAGRLTKKRRDKSDTLLKQTTAKIMVGKLEKGTSEFTSGRTGEVVFVSDDQRATLVVVQNGK